MTETFVTLHCFGNYEILQWIAYYWGQKGHGVRFTLDMYNSKDSTWESALLQVEVCGEFKGVRRDNVVGIVEYLKQEFPEIEPPKYSIEGF